MQLNILSVKLTDDLDESLYDAKFLLLSILNVFHESYFLKEDKDNCGDDEASSFDNSDRDRTAKKGASICQSYLFLKSLHKMPF